jgi:hypothetical protein
MKSVPNWISYPTNFSSLPGYFSGASNQFRSYLKLKKNADVWGPSVSGIVAPRRALVGCCGWRCSDVRHTGI